MRAALWPSCATLLVFLLAGNARADWPRINNRLAKRRVTIHKALILPPQLAYYEGSREQGSSQQAEQITAAMYSAVSRELTLRGVSILPNPMDTAKTEAEKFAVADLQARFDTIAVLMRRKPRWVDDGKISLDDRVAAFAPGAGSDALVFIRGASGREPNFLGTDWLSVEAEISFVDAKTGESLALITLSSMCNRRADVGMKLAKGVHKAMHDLPLPLRPR